MDIDIISITYLRARGVIIGLGVDNKCYKYNEQTAEWKPFYTVEEKAEEVESQNEI